VYEPESEDVAGSWSDCFSSPNIISVIKSRRMKWAGYVARMGEKRNLYAS